MASGGSTCAVVGCTNNSRKRKDFMNEICPIHKRTRWTCCPVPFALHSMPKDETKTREWLAALKLKHPPKKVYVCSYHFVDRKPTELHPNPELFLGHDYERSLVKKGRRRKLIQCQEKLEERDKASETSASTSRTEVQQEQDEPRALDAAYVCIQELEAKIQELEAELTELKLYRLHFHRFCASDEDICFYARFPSLEVFNVFWEAIQPSASMLMYWSKAQKKGPVSEPNSPGPTCRLQLIDEFFLYCCRVAVGQKEKVLADVFQVSVSTVCSTVITWANYLYLILGSLPIWMSRKQVKATMPLKFRQHCPEVRVIIDCTEVQCQSQSSLTLQSEVFSSYKNTTTFKGLIGIAPCGAVTFVSSLFTGSISDRELFERCGMLDLLEPGDGCMADKGFTIEKMLAARGAKLIIPPFKTTEQFSTDDALKTKAKARLRILVERAIKRVKEYHIWDTTLPLTLSGTANQLWTNCCLMTNFLGPLDLKAHIPVA